MFPELRQLITFTVQGSSPREGLWNEENIPWMNGEDFSLKMESKEMSEFKEQAGESWGGGLAPVMASHTLGIKMW